MSDIRTITLAGRTFDVPPLPLRVNMAAYPICQRLSNGSLIQKFTEAVVSDAAFSSVAISAEEMEDLATLAFLGASTADRDLTRDAFDDLPINPGELIEAFYSMRYQTGVWKAVPVNGTTEPGEAKRARKPRKSTSAASLPA